MMYLEYEFFRNALVSVMVISIAAGIIGTYIITRRMVAISGGVTHACFGGLGLGNFLGVSPVLMAAVFAVVSSAGVEWMSRKVNVREDSAIAVVWAVGMAVGVLFVFLTPGYVPELNSFLFGNILTVTGPDIAVFGIYTFLLVAFMALYYRKIVACAFDPDFSTVSGLPVKAINYTMTIFVALCIVLTIRLVGVMLLMSMLSLPIMSAEVVCHRYGPIMALSVVISLCTAVGGLFIGALVDVPCSAIIVMLMVAVYVALKAISIPRNRSKDR